MENSAAHIYANENEISYYLITQVIFLSHLLLGEYALANCDALTSVEFGLGSQLNTISSFAFYDCDLLEDIEIPANVE